MPRVTANKIITDLAELFSYRMVIMCLQAAVSRATKLFTKAAAYFLKEKTRAGICSVRWSEQSL
jgi:hypothetical protein